MKQWLTTLSLIFLLLVSSYSHAFKLSLPENESAYVYVYQGYKRNLAILLLHGRGSHPNEGVFFKYIQHLSHAGYSVYAPTMPWIKGKYQGNLNTAIETIAKVVKRIHKKNRYIVLVAEDLAASTALLYVSSASAQPIVGLVTITPTRTQLLNPSQQAIYTHELSKARRLIEQGKAKQKIPFKMIIHGKQQTIPATAQFYSAFYGPEFPALSLALPYIQIPVLWISDQANRSQTLYDKIPHHLTTQYLAIQKQGPLLMHTVEPVLNFLLNFTYLNRLNNNTDPFYNNNRNFGIGF